MGPPAMDTVALLAGRIGSTLMAETLCSAVLAAVVWGVLRVHRRATPALRLALWGLVFVRLIVPPAWGHPLSARAALDRIRAAAVSSAPAAVVLGAIREVEVRTSMRTAEFDQDRRGRHGAGFELALAAGWLAGSVGSLGLYLARARGFRRRARLAPVSNDPRVLALVGAWRARLRIRRQIRVVTTDGPMPPFTIGLVRPLVAIPRGLLCPGRESALEHVVAHELAHVRRADAFWLAAQHWVRAAYFFNPAVWYAGRQIALARECACDALVLADRRISPRRYGQTLLAVLQETSGGCRAPVAGMSAAARTWRARLASLGTPPAPTRWRRVEPTFAALALGLVVLPMGAPPLAVPSAPPEARTPAPDRVRHDTTVARGLDAPGASSSERAVVQENRPSPAFRIPLAGGRLVSGFGFRQRPGGASLEYHAGIDLAAGMEAPVVAAADGTVVAVRPPAGRLLGVVTIVHDPRHLTVYTNLDDPRVEPGQRVSAGQPIGLLRAAGSGTRRHLHFQINRDGHPVDPWPIVGHGR